uniref:B30.2/SPRY domain-containing protein n=1 Tax=Ornithorhynchus anatinus TaxID=9258 RepID=A0A6I8PBE6_ORNAN
MTPDAEAQAPSTEPRRFPLWYLLSAHYVPSTVLDVQAASKSSTAPISCTRTSPRSWHSSPAPLTVIFPCSSAGWRRARLHPVDVTLDPDTAHPKLVISEDRRWVKHGDKRQDVPDNPERFDYVVSVLGSQRFTAGSHYWEVHVGNKTKWILGVCSESVSRKGKITASPLTGHWVVRLSRGNEYEALTSPQTPFRLKNPPRRVGIFLDYDAGVVSFYNVTDETHIYTFTYSFSGPLRPFFEPCLHDEGKNAAPLIICPVSQESEELARGPSPSLEAPWGMGKKVSLGTDGPLAPPRPAPDRYPLKDMILSWPSDLAPALQSFRAPSF